MEAIQLSFFAITKIEFLNVLQAGDLLSVIASDAKHVPYDIFPIAQLARTHGELPISCFLEQLSWPRFPNRIHSGHQFLWYRYHTQR